MRDTCEIDSRYTADVRLARLAWSLLSAADAREPRATHYLSNNGPVFIQDRNTAPDVLTALVARGALAVHVQPTGPRRRYTITPAGEDLLARLDKWLHYEQQSVLDWRGET